MSADRSGNVLDINAKSEADRDELQFAMNLSLVIGLLMFMIKTSAYMLTGSSAILSDAVESVTHVAAVFASLYIIFESIRKCHWAFANIVKICGSRPLYRYCIKGLIRVDLEIAPQNSKERLS